MILTKKIKHCRDFTDELRKAKKVAEFAIKYRSRSSKDVKHLGLKSLISNAILKKYSRNKKVKNVKSVKLTIPNQGIKLKENQIYISCLKLHIPFDIKTEKINQVELDNTYAYVSYSVPEKKEYIPGSWIGIDRNTTGHCIVAANPSTGKVFKLGKKANHIHTKYKSIRRKLQKGRKYKNVKRVKNKESRIVRDLNHKISRNLVTEAKKKNAGLVLEDLKGIRKNVNKKLKKRNKSFKGSLNSWSYYQLAEFIKYKAKILGVPVVYVDPHYTSQQCSRCGLLGSRNKKEFKCPHCGHVENADVNAAFVIARRHINSDFRLLLDRDISKSTSVSAQESTL